jgi:Tfp pilus assembly pilus retraction ATPase PilT
MLIRRAKRSVIIPLMPVVKWDRLLETCFRQGGTAMLITVGSPPFIQIAELWRAMQIDPLARRDLVGLAEQVLGSGRGSQRDGYAYLDFAYGNVARFRAMAFGYPKTSVLLISRWPEKRKT